MASKIKSRHVYKHQCKIPVTIGSLLLCLLHGFPCRIYLLAHYAFVASKIRMAPQGNEIFYSRFQGRLHGKHCSYSETLQLLMLIIDTKAL